MVPLPPFDEHWLGRVSLWLEPGTTSTHTVQAVMDFLAARQAELHAFLALDPWRVNVAELPWAMEIGATTGLGRPLGSRGVLRQARELERLIRRRSASLAFKASIEQVHSDRDAGLRYAAEAASLLVLDAETLPGRDMLALMAAVPIPLLLASWRSLPGPVLVALAGNETDTAVLRLASSLRRDRFPFVAFAPDPEAAARTFARSNVVAEFRRTAAGYGLLRYRQGGLLVLHRQNPLVRMLPRLRQRFSVLLA